MSQVTITKDLKVRTIKEDNNQVQPDLLCKGNPDLWDSPYLSSFDRFEYLEKNPEIALLEEEAREDALEEAGKIHMNKRMMLEAESISICRQCPFVKTACLEMTMDYERQGAKIYGVSAGMGEVERRKIVKRMNREERKSKALAESLENLTK